MDKFSKSAAKTILAHALVFIAVSVQAQVTWNIVGTAPGEPDLVGTVTTPGLPFSCGQGPPSACPFFGTLTIPAGALGGGAAVTFDPALDPDEVLINISASPPSPGDEFFLFDMNKLDILCDSQSAFVLQCSRPFNSATADFNLVLTEQTPGVAIGDGNVVITGELQVAGQRIGPPEPTFYSIGDTGPAGGIVFYVTHGGLHGLEAAPYHQGNAEWGCYTTPISGADGTIIGAGAQNTLDILVGCAQTIIASRLADSYSLNGFDDWFLPSEDELNLMYQNLYLAGLGGFWANPYWSSSEFDDDFALIVDFFDGTQGAQNKDGPANVRAIRAF